MLAVLVPCLGFAKTANGTVDVKGFSAEEIFEAIYFMKGPAAERLSDFHYLNVHSSLENNDVFCLIVDTINSENPTFFEDFKKGIQSDNLFEVNRAFDDGHLKLSIIADKIKEDLKKSEQFGALDASKVASNNEALIVFFDFVLVPWPPCSVVAVCAVVMVYQDMDAITESKPKKDAFVYNVSQAF